MVYLMAHELEVWLFAEHVGFLRLLEGRLNFSYNPSWLAQANAVALSASLPLQAEPFDDHKSRPFFAGLLPEGQMRRLIAQQFQVSGQNDFALLQSIGGECAGAVSFLESGNTLPVAKESSDVHCSEVQWLNDDDVVTVLDELPAHPMLAGRDGLRLSLAGAQDKLPVVFDGRRIGLPLNGTPSTHILKPPIHAVKDSVINESFCMALAQTMRLRPAKSTVHVVLNQ
jgi:serine/threonine-protein kinase HipA